LQEAFMGKADVSVDDLVGMIQRGELRLPEMQRRYVWKATRVRDLFDSLYRGYPSGAILVWETDEVVPLQKFAVEQEGNPYHSTRLLLDGQQRLTSLSAVLRGEPISVKNKKRPIELLFNLEHPAELSIVAEVDDNSDDDEEPDDDEVDSTDDELQRRFDKMAFVVATKKLEQLPHWVKVSEIFKSESDKDFLKRAGITSLDDPRCERYSQRLAKVRGIKKYMYRMDILERSLGYNEVTEIFVRVNSLGAKLRSSDLALAQITAKWRNSLAIFQDFAKTCADEGFDLDLGVFLRNLIIFATEQARFLTVGSVSLERLQAAWEASCSGFQFALNFIRSNVHIDSPALLSSPSILLVIGFLGSKVHYQLSNEEADRLRLWALLANAKGRYSRGSSDSILDQDLATIRQGGRANELIDRLRQQVGRLDIAADELEGRNQRSALFKTMFLAFRADGARDWHSNLAIALDHSGSQHRLQFHHIFPKAVLKKGGISAHEADDIANLAFIGGKTNRSISDKTPATYLPPLVEKLGPGAFSAQCIPVRADVLQVGEYKAFIKERREIIAKRLNSFLGLPELSS
jgi:hypothetical protein